GCTSRVGAGRTGDAGSSHATTRTERVASTAARSHETGDETRAADGATERAEGAVHEGDCCTGSGYPTAAFRVQRETRLMMVATETVAFLAGWTGLEPAASGVTGRRYNRLNYHPKTSGGRIYMAGA